LSAAGRWTAQRAKQPGTQLTGRAAFLMILIVGALVAGSVGFNDSPKPSAAGAGAPATSYTRIPETGTASSPVSPTSYPATTTPAGPVIPGAASFRLWADQHSAALGIPVLALAAYAYAEQVMAVTQPSCRLSWTTLAGIGKVASNHGQQGGAALDASGVARPTIIGPALDGRGGRATVRDTDLGKVDTDSVYDRRVGPMQFTPANWRIFGQDADGDHNIDINDIDDGALAAARLLCAGGRDLGTVNGWWSGIGDYNYLGGSGNAIFNAANDYGQRSTTNP
jgi:membrane-bound lytic murein transglycosylase B